MKRIITPVVVAIMLPILCAMQDNQVIVATRKRAAANPCASVPSWTAQYKSTTTPGSGAFSSWTDSSGNSNTATGGGALSDSTDPTPNSQRTVRFTNVGGQGYTLTNSITASTAITVCGVYKVNSFLGYSVLTGNTAGANNPTYFAHANNTNTAGKQELNNEAVTMLVGTANVTTSWTDTCAVFTVGGAWAMYKDGASDGTGTSAQTFNKPITNLGVTGGVGGSLITVAEIDILNGTAINSTQATDIHNCAVSTYGVP